MFTIHLNKMAMITNLFPKQTGIITINNNELRRNSTGDNYLSILKSNNTLNSLLFNIF